MKKDYVGMLTADVTGDGILDVLGGASLADLGVANAGAIHLWKGGLGLVGEQSSTVRFTVPDAAENDYLGYYK